MADEHLALSDDTATGHLVFVGMMGSGKTTVAKRVAAHLRRRFIDADDALVTRTGRSIADWFATDGEEAFRDAESEVLIDLLAESEPIVIATGGGVVVRDANRVALSAPDRTVVWLRASPKFLGDRISAKPSKPHRPLLSGDVYDTLGVLDSQRRDLYQQVADVIIDIEPIYRGGDQSKTHLARVVIDVLETRGLPGRRNGHFPESNSEVES